jgi:Putative prokaryotic signal transducing protein
MSSACEDDRMNDELVQIWSTGDPMIAELTRARLEDAGIDVLVKSSMGGSNAYPVGPSYLFVKADQEQDARAVIQAIEAGEYAIDDADVEEMEQAPPASDA